MLKPIAVLFGVGVLFTTMFAVAQQPVPQVKMIPIKPTSSASGKQMFATYCAACHGKDGKGNGPAASAMKKTPIDLTSLSKDNGGKFPAGHVSSVLQFGVSDTAHGSKEMPVWGATFSESQTAFAGTPGEVQLRVQNLVKYLQSIQQ